MPDTSRLALIPLVLLADLATLALVVRVLL